MINSDKKAKYAVSVQIGGLGGYFGGFGGFWSEILAVLAKNLEKS